MTGSTFKRCPHGTACPDLSKRRHGSWFYAIWIWITGGKWLLRRGGFVLERDAEAALRQVRELIALDPDPVMRAKIGDMIKAATLHGGPLPDPSTIRRKIGAGMDPASPELTVADWLRSWLAGKGKLRASVRRSYLQHIDLYLVPLIGHLPLVRLGAGHIGDMFATIRGWNAEVERQRAEGRASIHCDGDVRKAPKVISDATMHRIFATLRAALNAAVKQRVIPWNPCAGVELPSAEHRETQVWGPAEVAGFLHATTGYRLYVAWRLVLLGGLRRGEVCGLRWDDIELDAGYVRIRRTLLEFGGRVTEGMPKTGKSTRVVGLDPDTVAALREYRKAQLAERLAAGGAYETGPSGGWVICDEIGRPYRPDLISARFKQAARAAGLPVIRLHDARHTHASLGLEAGVAMKVMSERLGHSKVGITQDLYTHVRPVVADTAAGQIAAFVAGSVAQ